MAGREGDGVCRAQARAAPAAVLLLPALRSSSSGLGSADRAVARGPVAWGARCTARAGPRVLHTSPLRPSTVCCCIGPRIADWGQGTR